MPPHPAHGVEEVRAAGVKPYEQALRDGRSRGADADEAPCLVDRPSSAISSAGRGF